MTAQDAAKVAAGLTQTDIDALWLASRMQLHFGDVPHNLRANAQLRLQRLTSAGIISHKVGEYPRLIPETRDD